MYPLTIANWGYSNIAYAYRRYALSRWDWSRRIIGVFRVRPQKIGWKHFLLTANRNFAIIDSQRPMEWSKYKKKNRFVDNLTHLAIAHYAVVVTDKEQINPVDGCYVIFKFYSIQSPVVAHIWPNTRSDGHFCHNQSVGKNIFHSISFVFVTVSGAI